MSTIPRLTDLFETRHNGPRAEEQATMLKEIGFSNLDDMTRATVPTAIRTKSEMKLGPAVSEYEALADIRAVAIQNQVWRSFIGLGYYDCITPPVIQRNILENPGWYTQYTPYQPEISQGRLEALLNFQTVVSDLTGLPISNASLLDEGTAAAEAMSMLYNLQGKEHKETFFISSLCHPQTIEVVKTRALPLGIKTVVGDHHNFDFKATPVFGALIQYPATNGGVENYSDFINKAHAEKALVAVATDLLALTILKSPGEMGADVVVGSAQRFGVPLGYGGPHAAFFSTKDEYKRQMPGRLVGVSIDADNRPALRLALQTREQHIRRAKATSNICTAQVLLAVMASMYAVYHGPRGLKNIAERVHGLTSLVAAGLQKLGYKLVSENFFDTLTLKVTAAEKKQLVAEAAKQKINLNIFGSDDTVGFSLDEATLPQEVEALLGAFAAVKGQKLSAETLVPQVFKTVGTRAELVGYKFSKDLIRGSKYLTHGVFNFHHSETEILRYMTTLQNKDLSLTSSMIPLGSCTMKLNATAEMVPVTWPEFGRIHPFVPRDQAKGYEIMIGELEKMLIEITGFDGVSLQPNAGSQGEYAGLLVIKKYLESQGQGNRDVCLIPTSAHGTNPASAVMAGFKVVAVACDDHGNVDLNDLRAKATENKNSLAALMVTYPSTHGVFEEGIVEICDIVHKGGGQVYMDGANMNAQVGLCKPGEFGPDVCHLNLHKTFCIPHGGGGPGMGPICVKKHLSPYLPSHPLVKMGGEKGVGAISAAPWGSASILPISYLYIRMMGADGLKRATQLAILNANYVAKRLEKHYPVLYKGREGLVAHECIIDLRPMKEAGVEVVDVAKRLMDYGFHAPTMSWPVAGTMMIEPTESEPKSELDRFCDAMIAISGEAREVAAGKMSRENNPLKNAPHTAQMITADSWDRPYSREKAAFPMPWVRKNKFWPSVSRINDPHGDRNLVCACPPMEEY